MEAELGELYGAADNDDGGVIVLAVKRRVSLVSKRTVYVPFGFNPT